MEEYIITILLREFLNQCLIKLLDQKSILDKVLFVNGQPGCGKTLFTSIMPTIPRVELLNFSTEIENICALYHLKKYPKMERKAL